MSILDDFTDNVLQEMQKAHTDRTMRLLESAEASHVQIVDAADTCNETHDVLLLASNSYLDLCNEPELKKAAADAILKWGTGSGGARLTTGNKTPHEELEKALAKFKGEEAAITFGTGYMANVGVLSALCSKQARSNGEENSVSECVVFSDELNHASIIDGIRLSKAKCIVYKHNDMDDLQRIILENRNRFDRGLIVTDAVFSMDGDLANLPELQKIAQENNCLLMIDEAHATGVIGKSGRGLAEHFNDMGIPCKHADVTVGTLSKAIGCEGGFVAGKQKLIDFLRNKARSFIFTTAMSPAMAQAAANNLKFIEENPERVQQLQENVKVFCKELNIPTSPSAIVPIIIGDEADALRASAELLGKGILVPAIRYPTVAKGQARLRASLMATHTKEELQNAARAIAKVLKG